MLGKIVASIVALLGQFLPLITSSSQVANVIQTLIAILPTVEHLAEDLYQPIKNIIAALQANSNQAATADQLQQLQQLDAQYDQAFEAAATAAQAEDSTS